MNTFSITDFGAVANCPELQTEKIQAAIDKCFLEGGGEVTIPEGVFMTGSIRLRSNITLHLLKNAVLKGSRNPEDYYGYKNDTVEPLPDELVTDGQWNRAEVTDERDYRFMRIPGSRWNHGLLKAINAENVKIIGEEGSCLDGSDCFDELGEENYRGPHCINMFYCKNIHFEGYTVKDSANWAHALFYCENVTADNVTAIAGHDGIHITVCNNVAIRNCKFYTGDDCVAGFANVNVLVTDCELNSACSAMRFGGTNVLVENCHMYGPCKYLFRGSMTDEEKRSGVKPSLEGHRNNMLSAFTYYSDFSVDIKHQPGNIIIRNCRIDYADRFLHYNYSGNEMWQQNRPLESITFENITATDISMPLTAYGDKDTSIKLTFKNVDISLRKGFEDVVLLHVCNYDKITLDNVSIKNSTADTLIKRWQGVEGDIDIIDLECDINEENLITDATEEFVCTPI